MPAPTPPRAQLEHRQVFSRNQEILPWQNCSRAVVSQSRVLQPPSAPGSNPAVPSDVTALAETSLCSLSDVLSDATLHHFPVAGGTPIMRFKLIVFFSRKAGKMLLEQMLTGRSGEGRRDGCRHTSLQPACLQPPAPGLWPHQCPTRAKLFNVGAFSAANMTAAP